MKSVRGRDNSLEIKDFSGGLITKSPPKNIDTKHSVDCQDVYSEGAMLRKRLGITVLNPTAASGNGNGLYNWNRSSESQWLMSLWGSSLYKMDITAGAWDGVWDLIEGSVGWDTFTKLMLHCDGTDGATTFTDEIGKTVTANGAVQIDTAQKVFGTAGALFDGNQDYLTVPASVDWNLFSSTTTGATIDLRFRSASFTNQQVLLAHYQDANNRWAFFVNTGSVFFRITKNGSLDLDFSATHTMATATWYHIALTKDSTNYKIFVDGVTIGSVSNATILTLDGSLRIGTTDGGVNDSPNGWLDEIRVSKGIARWTADFTVPTAAYAQTNLTFSNSTMYFSNFNSTLIMSTDSWDEVQRMTVNETSFVGVATGGSGTAPRAKFVFNWKNHAWYANLIGSEDTIVHSAVNSYNNFTGSTYGSNLLFTENDISLTGGFLLNGRLYITKGFSMHRFTYTGTASPLVDIRQIKSTVGTKSPRSIKNVDTPEGEVVLFLGTNKKLYRFDGQDALEISDAIDVTNGVATVYMQNINADALKTCFAEVNSELNWYELFVCIGTATVPNYSIVYDYRLKSFWPMSNRNFTYGTLSDNGAGKKVIYVQGATNGIAYLTNSTGSDNGTAINGFWTSEKLGKSIILEKIDEVEVETEAVACTPTFSWRADWETTWVDKTMGSSTNSHNWSPGRIDNMIQFKIADNSVNPSFKLWSIIGSQRAVGGGK